MKGKHKATIQYAVSLGYGEMLRMEQVKRGLITVSCAIDQGLTQQLQSEFSIARDTGNKQVTLVLMSGGGSIYEALATHDLLRGIIAMGTKVNIYVLGAAASAAAMIVLQAGSKRYAAPNARLMVHELSLQSGLQTRSEIEETAVETKKLQESILQILSARSGHSVQELMKKLNKGKDVWFSAQEAKDWGLIDAVKEVDYL